MIEENERSNRGLMEQIETSNLKSDVKVSLDKLSIPYDEVKIRVNKLNSDIRIFSKIKESNNIMANLKNDKIILEDRIEKVSQLMDSLKILIKFNENTITKISNDNNDNSQIFNKQENIINNMIQKIILPKEILEKLLLELSDRYPNKKSRKQEVYNAIIYNCYLLGNKDINEEIARLSKLTISMFDDYIKFCNSNIPIKLLILKDDSKCELAISDKFVDSYIDDKYYYACMIEDEKIILKETECLDQQYKKDLENFYRSGELTESEYKEELSLNRYLVEIENKKQNIKDLETKISVIDKLINQEKNESFQNSSIDIEVNKYNSTLYRLENEMIILTQYFDKKISEFENKETLTTEIKIPKNNPFYQYITLYENYLNEKEYQTLKNEIEMKKDQFLKFLEPSISSNYNNFDDYEELKKQLIIHLHFLKIINDEIKEVDNINEKIRKDNDENFLKLDVCSSIDDNTFLEFFKKINLLDDEKINILENQKRKNAKQINGIPLIIKEKLNEFKISFPKRIVLLTNKYEKKLIEIIKQLEGLITNLEDLNKNYEIEKNNLIQIEK